MRGGPRRVAKRKRPRKGTISRNATARDDTTRKSCGTSGKTATESSTVTAHAHLTNGCAVALP